MQVNINDAYTMLVDCVLAKLVPFLKGSPGCGKSDLVRKLANEYNLQLIDLRLSNCDPTDFSGYPQVDSKTGRSFFCPMSTFPLENDPLPAGKNGWLIFLDELNAAPPAIIASAYKLILDKQVGDHKLHKNVVLVAAGNLDTDKAYTNKINTAMQSRLIHIELDCQDYKSWLAWAADNQIDYRIQAFINFRPEFLNQFDPNHKDSTFACQRTWEFLSRLIKKYDPLPADKLPLLAGTVSEGIAREFMGFCDNFKDLVPIPEIIAHPDTAQVPEEPSAMYAMAGCLGNHLDSQNGTPLMTYMSRLHIEHQVVALQMALRRDRALTAIPAVQGWISKNAARLF